MLNVAPSSKKQIGLWALGIWGAVLLATMAANAQSISPFFTYQGRAFDANGTTPLLHTVSFKIQIRSANGACLLYEEQQNGINLASTNGLFNLNIGSMTGDSKRTGDDAGLTMARIFSNNGTVRSADATFCPGGYTPTSGDKRRLRVTIIDGATTTTLTPDQDIVTTPYATVAETLQGFTPSGFIQVTGAVNQADLNAILLKKTELLNLASLESTLSDLAAGSSSLYMKPSAGGMNLSNTGNISLSAQKSLQLGGYTSAQQTTLVGSLGSSDKGKTWFNTSDNQMYYWDGTAARAVGTSSAVSTVTASAPLVATGTTSVALSLQTGAGLTTSGGNLVPDFGTASGKVAQGNDTRFNPSFVAGDANKFVQLNGTGTSYVLRTASEMRTALGLGASATLAVGTTSSTVAAGDDSRIVGALPKAGGTMTGALTLATGTTTLSPLVIPAGTLKTTPAAGDFEFNGTTFFFTNGSNVRQRVSSYDASLTPSNGDALIWNGSAWAPGAVSSGTLPDATGSTKGGVIVGTGLGVSSGTISVAYGTGSGTAVQGNDARMNPAPAAGVATNYVRVNSGGTAYEHRTAAQTVTDLGLGATATLGIGTGLTSGGGNLKADFAPSTSAGLPTGTSKVVADDHYRLNPATVLGDANKMIRVNATGSGYELRTATEVKSDLGLGTAAGYNVGTGNGNIPQLDGSGKLASSVLPSTYSSFQSTGITDNATATAMTIDSSGKVGIGTTSPTAPLTVISTDNGSNLWVESNQNNASMVLNNTQSGGNKWEIGSTGGSAGVASSFRLVENSTSTPFVINSSLDVGIGQNITSSSLSGANFVVLHGGNVGIGTTTPGQKLDVQSTGASQIQTRTTDVTTSSRATVATIADTADLSIVTHGSARTVSRYGLTLGGWSELLVGGSSPNGLVLGTGTAAPIVIGTNGAERFRVDSSGNVGIGTTAPSSSLEVTSQTSTQPLTLSSYVSGTYGGNIVGAKARGTLASPTAVTTDDQLALLLAKGYTSGGAFSGNVGSIGIYAAENYTGIANGSYIAFGTTSLGATSRSERMRIDPAGNVGIGTSTPAAKLDVAGGIKIANDTATCDSTKYGTLRYASNVVELCNSSGWTGIASTGTGASTSGNNTFSGSNIYSGTSTFTGAASFSAAGPSAALDVSGGGLQTTSLNVTSATTMAGNLNVGSGKFFVDSSGGKVGVGTASPSFKVDAQGTGTVVVGATTTDATTSSVAQLRAIADSSNAGIYSHSSARTISRYGLTLGGWAELNVADNTGTSNGLAIGVTPAKPIVFGTADTERMRIDGSGNVGIGTTSPTSKVHIVDSNNATSGAYYSTFTDLSFAPSTAASTNVYATDAVARFAGTAASTGNVVGSQFNARNESTSSLTALTASNSISQNVTTGTVTSAIGAYGAVQNLSTGTVTSAYGLSANVNNASTGTITNSYELYTSTNNSGTITNQYGIYQATASSKNYFAGNVGIGTTSPKTSLQVAGPVAVSNNSSALDSYLTNVFGSISSTGSPGLTILGDSTDYLNYANLVGNVGQGSPTFAMTAYNGTASSPTAIQNGDSLATFQFCGTYGSGWASTGCPATLDVQAAGNFTGVGTLSPSKLTISSSSSIHLATAGNSRLVVNSSGNIGIGTTTPAAKLEVAGGIKIANDTATCDNTKYGTLRYASNVIELCNSSGWVGIASTSGNNTVSGSNTYSGSSTFTGAASFSSAGPSPALDVSGGGLQSTSLNVTGTTTMAGNVNVDSGTFYVDSSGDKVGIGNTSPGAKLAVKGAAGVPATTGTTQGGIFRIEQGTSDNAMDFGSMGSSPWTVWIQSSNRAALGTNNPLALNPNGGNVGIGTISPSSKLEIADNTIARQTITSAGTGAYSEIYLQASRGTLASPTATQSGDILARITFGGRGATGVTNNRATITARASENFTDSANGTQLEFATTPNGSATVATRMTIDNSGSVGIGTSSPSAKLHVAGGQILSTNSSGAVEVNTAASIDWNKGNIQTLTTADCASTTFTNMLDGGTYTLVIKETGTTTCAFSHSGLTFHLPPDHGARTSGKHTVYTFLRAGNDVYASWIPGF